MTGHLGYDHSSGRYGLLVSDLFERHFHCGDKLMIEDEGEWTTTTMEMTPDGEWYLKGTQFKGKSLDGIRAKI